MDKTETIKRTSGDLENTILTRSKKHESFTRTRLRFVRAHSIAHYSVIDIELFDRKLDKTETIKGTSGDLENTILTRSNKHESITRTRLRFVRAHSIDTYLFGARDLFFFYLPTICLNFIDEFDLLV